MVLTVGCCFSCCYVTEGYNFHVFKTGVCWGQTVVVTVVYWGQNVVQSVGCT